MTCKECQHHGQRWVRKIEGCSTCASYAGPGVDCLNGKDSDANITIAGKATCKLYKRADDKLYGWCYPKINGLSYPYRYASENDPACEYANLKESDEYVEYPFETEVAVQLAAAGAEQLELAL